MGTCDICDTDYNTDNWEPGLMTIFITWQLIVTLDSIRNSCDVIEPKHNNSYERKIDSNLVPLADANFPSMIPGP